MGVLLWILLRKNSSACCIIHLNIAICGVEGNWKLCYNAHRQSCLIGCLCVFCVSCPNNHQRCWRLQKALALHSFLSERSEETNRLLQRRSCHRRWLMRRSFFCLRRFALLILFSSSVNRQAVATSPAREGFGFNRYHICSGGATPASGG